MYRQSTDSIRLFAERSSHGRMLFASPQEYVYIECSHRFRMPRSRSDVNTALGNYLSNCSFYVVYGDHSSSTPPVAAGVPQGSI